MIPYPASGGCEPAEKSPTDPVITRERPVSGDD